MSGIKPAPNSAGEAPFEEAGWARVSQSGKSLVLEFDDGRKVFIGLDRITKLVSGAIRGARFFDVPGSTGGLKDGT